MAKVIITKGPGTGTEYEIEHAAILGRLDTSDIPVRDKKASREHAKIYKQGRQYAIVDLNSSNGTFVNDDPITKHMLESGDSITIGLVSMRFEDPDAEAAKQGAIQKRSKLDEDFRTAGAPAGGGGKIDRDVVLKSHQPLQFRKIKPGRTLLGFDLDQVSDGGRFVIYTILILIFAALMYVSYSAVVG